MPTDLTLRPATVADLPEVAEVYLVARAAAESSGAMPPGVHAPAEVRRWVAGWDVESEEVWLAETESAIVGFAHLTDTWLDALYVRPEAQGNGIGSALLELAMSVRPDGLGLWVFESNAPARRFYRRHGFVEVERTDGSGNEEHAPDLAMRWPAPDQRGATVAAGPPRPGPT